MKAPPNPTEAEHNTGNSNNATQLSCSNCGKDGGNDGNGTSNGSSIKACSICRTAHYCDAECQRGHWPLHRADCTRGACEQLIKAVASNNVPEVRRLAKTKRVLNGRIDYHEEEGGEGEQEEEGEEQGEGNDGDGEDHHPREETSRALGKWSALHECIRQDNVAMLRVMLEYDPRVDILDVDGETPAFVASSGRNAGLVRLLLEAGADPNAKARDGWSCLMMASRNGDCETVRALLEGGASVRAGTDMFGRDALQLVDMMRSGQGAVRMADGESYEQSVGKYQDLYALLSQYA